MWDYYNWGMMEMGFMIEVTGEREYENSSVHFIGLYM